MADQVFKLQITCANEAFEDDAAAEIARCLEDVARRLRSGESFDYYRNVADANGNSVGAYAMKPRGEH